MVTFEETTKANRPKGQHEKYKELESASKQIKRDISQLFKRLRHIKKAMKKYTQCAQCSKYFIVGKVDSEKSFIECPHCGARFYIF
jgi:DNA-directed RNA polymerase subunit RPC12/RpoP